MDAGFLRDFVRAAMQGDTRPARYKDCEIAVNLDPASLGFSVRLKHGGCWYYDMIPHDAVVRGSAGIEEALLASLEMLWRKAERAEFERRGAALTPYDFDAYKPTPLSSVEATTRYDFMRRAVEQKEFEIEREIAEKFFGRKLFETQGTNVLSETSKFSDLFAHQREGARFLAAHSTALLADEPGLGKTAQAIAACDLVQAEKVLVICPAVAKENWRREFQRWQTKARSILVQYGSIFTVEAVTSAHVLILNYELLQHATLLLALKAKPRPVMIVDEAHYLKSSAAKRTQTVYGDRVMGGDDVGLCAGVKYIWLLTGTPAPNHAGEVWTHLRALSPGTLGSDAYHEIQFQEQFCEVRDTVYGRQITGSKNLKELAGRLKGWMLRRKKSDVMADLPPLRFAPEPLSGVKMQATPEMKRIVEGDLSDDDLLAALRSADVHLATERRMTGLLKMDAAAALVSDTLTGNKRKLVIFAVHNEVIDGLKERALVFGAVLIKGDTPHKERQAAIDRFQNDPDCRVFIGNIKAAGTAITLHAASEVLFVETSWTPSDNYQAACRCHRIGQRDAVLARLLYLPGSIDETVQRVLARKANDLTELFG